MNYDIHDMNSNVACIFMLLTFMVGGSCGMALGCFLAECETRATSDRKARSMLLAWAESGGFAATHGAGASSGEIADNFLKYMDL